MGGQSYTSCFHDVWYSTNGKNWTQATNAAGWTARSAHTSVVFDTKMWVIGGMPNNGTFRLNDVWYSTDGANWTCADTTADWAPRGWHTSVVYDNKIWALGGDSTINSLTMSDVWSSFGLGVDENEIDKPPANSDLLIYPIPAKDMVHVHCQSRLDGIRIYDAAGNLAKEIDLKDLRQTSSAIRISLEGLTSGVYFLKAKVAGAEFTKKLVIR